MRVCALNWCRCIGVCGMRNVSDHGVNQIGGNGFDYYYLSSSGERSQQPQDDTISKVCAMPKKFAERRLAFHVCCNTVMSSKAQDMRFWLNSTYDEDLYNHLLVSKGRGNLDLATCRVCHCTERATARPPGQSPYPTTILDQQTWLKAAKAETRLHARREANLQLASRVLATRVGADSSCIAATHHAHRSLRAYSAGVSRPDPPNYIPYRTTVQYVPAIPCNAAAASTLV
eukprot:363076-Chlamydomonas_euryale.AAC.3